MDVQAIKLELMQMLLNTNEENILLKLKEILDSKGKQGLEARNELIENAQRSNTDIQLGNVHTPEEIEKLLEKRFGA